MKFKIIFLIFAMFLLILPIVFSANYFGDGSDGVVTISSDTELDVTNNIGLFDGDMVVMNYESLTVNSGITLTTNQSGRGLLIYVQGNLDNNGIISVTARGARADPANDVDGDGTTVTSTGIRLGMLDSGGSDTLIAAEFNGTGTASRTAMANQEAISGNGTIFTIARVGASGGASVSDTGSDPANPGLQGDNGTTGQSGGGGSGGASGFSGNTGNSGTGSAGTCFSGGSGGAGCRARFSTPLTGDNADSFGGEGGDGALNCDEASAGGAGNPNGDFTDGSGATTAFNGTGGLVIIIVGGDVTGTGKVLANGSNGGSGARAPGAASGGGNILVLYAGSLSSGISFEAIGGTGGIDDGEGAGDGGDGGNGSVQVSLVSPIIPDIIPPKIDLINLSSGGGLGQIIYNEADGTDFRLTGRPRRTNDTTPTFRANTTENSNCDIYDNRTKTLTDCSTTGTLNHICTQAVVLPIGVSNQTINCSDSNGNINYTQFRINISDAIAPQVNLINPLQDMVFKEGINDSIFFKFNSTDNYDNITNAEIFIDGVSVYTNATYINGTNGTFLSTITIGAHYWNVTVTDSFNNINSSTANFTVEVMEINFTLHNPINNTLVYTSGEKEFNVTFNFTEQIDKCFLYINSTVNQSNGSKITSNTKFTFRTNLTNNQDYTWTAGCNISIDGSKNSSDINNFFIHDYINISFSFPTSANDSIIDNNSILINVSTRGRIENYILEWDGVNETVVFNSTLGLLINKTGLEDLTTYTYKVYVNDTNGNSNSTELRTVFVNIFGIEISLGTGISYTFRPFIENETLRLQNISCTGQNQTVGCLNVSVFGANNLNLSLLFNITLDPVNQKIIEDFGFDVLNWTTFHLHSNNTDNRTLLNATVVCGEVQSLNFSGLFEYRFNNSLKTIYINKSNESVLINVSTNCSAINYYTLNLNGTQKNISGYDAFNFSWKGDNSTNRINVSLIDDAGTIVSSIALTLSNTDYNASGMLLGSLVNISRINVTVANVSGTSALSGFFIRDMKITNITSNQSKRVRMKASCSGHHYQNATLLVPDTFTQICPISAGTITKYVWLFQDINLTEKGMRWKLQYNVTKYT